MFKVAETDLVLPDALTAHSKMREAAHVGENLTGEILVRDGVLRRDQLNLCLEIQKQLSHIGQPAKIGEVILSKRFATWNQIKKAINESQALSEAEVPDEIKREFGVFVHGIKDGHTLRVSSVTPLSEESKAEIIEKLRHIAVTAIEEEIMDRRSLLSALHSDDVSIKERLILNIRKLNQDPSDGQILQQVVTGMLVDALTERASDIHIKKSTETIACTLYYRIDGSKTFKYLLSPDAIGALIVRLKIMADLDVSDSSRALDGQIRFQYKAKQVDVRISTEPTVDGEKVVLRLLNPDSLPPLAELFKYYPSVLRNMQAMIDLKLKTGGLALLTGPTGSGKTTTLQGTLVAMDRDNLNIMTIEDPVEFRILDICQTSINESKGMTFQTGLRHQVRQDPDVLVVGETRDSITVESTFRSVESGHFVFSTLHTTSIRQTIKRLIGMTPKDYRGSAMFVLANYLKAILNQRLIPKLCDCAETVLVGDIANQRYVQVARLLGLSDSDKVKSAKGCARCHNTGYHGRALVLEAAFFPPDPSLREGMKSQFLSGMDSDEESFDADSLLKLDGVQYVSRVDSLRALLQGGVINLAWAFIVLEFKDGTE